MLGILSGAFMTATRSVGFTDLSKVRAAWPERGLGVWLRTRIGAAVQRAEEIRSARDLYGMDDALLRDIGLTRSEAEELARTGRIDRTRAGRSLPR